MTKILVSKENSNPTTQLRKTSVNENIGLSNCLHLTANRLAKVTVKSFQNGEGQLFITENRAFPKKQKSTKRGRSKGSIIQDGLTRRGRKTIRIISDCYNNQIRKEDGTSCRFHTLTFRNIIPDDRSSKILLDSYFKRLTRRVGCPIDYLWVAERQKRGAIHFHVLTPENLSPTNDHEGRVEENIWVNVAWNEVNINWALSTNKITKTQANTWKDELSEAQAYYKALDKYKHGKRKTKPRKPSKSVYLLLPNCITVFNTGRYMTKYMSKEGQKIVGGMYGASMKSREYLSHRILVEKSVESIAYGNEVVNYLEMRAKAEGIFVGVHQLPHNDCKSIWCPNVYRLMEWYYEFWEAAKLRHPLNFGL